MIRTLALAAALLPSLATAGSTPTQCHPGGGGGGGGGTGTTSTGHVPIVYDGYQRVHTPRRYVEDTNDCPDETADITGYRHCSKFGEWGMSQRLPPLFVELGMNMRHFNNGLGDRMQSVTHGAETFQYRIVMPANVRNIDVAMTSDMRVGVGLGHGIYLAVDAEFGGLSSPANATTEMMTTGTYGSPNVAQGTDMMIAGAGVVGMRGTTKYGAFGVEMAGGARTVRYTFDSTYHDCNQTNTITATDAMVEARARGELWLGPWLTAGATIGSSVISRGDWLAGIYLGVHTHSYDGSR